MNFLGQVLPVAFSLLTIPVVVRTLGVSSFAVLALAWAVQSYFVFFDFGLSRATTNWIAGKIADRDGNLVLPMVSMSIRLQAALGILGGVLLASSSSMVVGILDAEAHILAQARAVLLLLSISVPFMIVSGALRGVLEGFQRFDLANAVSIPSAILSTASPLVGIWLGLAVQGIIALQVLVTGLATIAYGVMANRLVRGFYRSASPVQWREVRLLASYGGWLALAIMLSPVLTSTDRFLIGAAWPVSEVAFYSAAYTIASKLWILANAMASTMFPVFSGMKARHTSDREILFGRAFKYLFLLAGAMVVVVAGSAESLLRLWLGAEFAAKGTYTLQILSIGFLANSMAWVPSTLIQGVGRPDVVAKLFLAEVVPYIALAWVLINNLGILGAAVAWSVRGVFELAFLLVASRRTAGVRVTILSQNGTVVGTVVFALLVLLGLYADSRLESTVLTQTAVPFALLSIFIAWGWWFVIDGSEREGLTKSLSRFTRRIGLDF